MPHIKNALIRYRVIDKALHNPYKPFPNKMDLRRACELELYGNDEGENISDSTIEKDLFAMRQEMDAPIKYSKIEKGYYYDDPNFSISEVPLSEDDISSIQFALNTLSQFKDNEIFQQFGFALNKIIDKFTVDTKKNQKDEEIIQFQQTTANLGNEFLAPLFSAIKEQWIVYFYYASFKSLERKRRKVVPLLLKEFDNRWYLISYDLVKEKIITYALDRIAELEVSEQKGEKPRNFNPDIFFKYAIGITASSESLPEKIVLEVMPVSARYLISQPLHKSQKICKELTDKYIFELFVSISEELIRELLSYGSDLIVIEPPSLKDIIKNRIHKMNQNYQD
ncbi:MAG: WYL domain-containing protein [Brumimicrobium sp.]|nr:WYL domain-containing protein [Brumimicrobium sp.]MCO5268529.1 WYL domain-containing protein [Brumimicrobium sp.]